MTRHRDTYFDSSLSGRDRRIVQLLGQWLEETLGRELRRLPPSSHVLDAGCGEEPWRELIESAGAVCVGLDIEQNARGSVAVIARLDAPLPDPWPRPERTYHLIVCSEVLEHVADWSLAFANLRRLCEAGGRVLITTPFLFPLHLEPHDYFRGTPHSLEHFARDHGFRLVQSERLGHNLDVVSTLIADTVIFPERPAFSLRARAWILRRLVRGLGRALGSSRIRRGIEVRGNGYLANVAVLEAE